MKPVLNAFRRHVKNPHIGLSLVHQSLERGIWLAREAARACIDRKFNLVAAQMLGQKLQRLKVLVEEAGATVVLQQPDAQVAGGSARRFAGDNFPHLSTLVLEPAVLLENGQRLPQGRATDSQIRRKASLGQKIVDVFAGINPFAQQLSGLGS